MSDTIATPKKSAVPPLPAYEQIWGQTCESLYQNPMAWAESIHAEDQARALACFERLFLGESTDFEYRIRTSDGSTRWIRDRAFPVRGPLGNLIRIARLAEDISEQKSYQETLLGARAAADSANLAKSRFLANMSHEIRTPMNGVLGMVELLVATPLSDAQRGYARVIESSGRALLALIDGILDLTKIEAQKVTLERVSCDLRAIAQDVVEALRSPADAKGLALCWSSTHLPTRLYGDPHRLRQVLSNLVANAVKFASAVRCRSSSSS